MTGPADTDAEPRWPRGSARAERRGHESATAVDARLRAQYPHEPPAATRATAAIVTVCLAWLLLVAALVAGGIALTAGHPTFHLTVLGLVLLLVALWLRPRFGRPAGRALEREQTPLLFALVDRIAAAAGTPAPARIVVDLSEDVDAVRHGLRGRATLRLGGRRWLALDPPVRVALLARELAETRNPLQGQLIRPVLTTVDMLARVFRVERSLQWLRRPDRPRGNLPLAVWQRLLWLIGRPILWLFLGVRSAALRTRLDADYRRDGVAAAVAGTAAAVALADRDLWRREADRVVYYAATHSGPPQWAAAVDARFAALADDLAAARARSADSINRWDGRLPPGRRAAALAGWSARVAQVRCDAGLEHELSGWYEAVRSDLLGPREFAARRAATGRP